MTQVTSSSILYDINDKPFGISYADWTVRWWKWWCGYEKTDPPTGVKDKDHDVFFLTTKAMLHYDYATLETDNELRSDMAILFPVDKLLAVGFPWSDDQLLKETSKKRIDMLPNISIKLDGVELTPSRVQTPVFDLHLKRDLPKPEEPENVDKIYKGRYKKTVGEGYWIFLKPNTLSKGKHEIPAFASCKMQVLSLAVSHTLNVS